MNNIITRYVLSLTKAEAEAQLKVLNEEIQKGLLPAGDYAEEKDLLKSQIEKNL
jgi:hypothetical protein